MANRLRRGQQATFGAGAVSERRRGEPQTLSSGFSDEDPNANERIREIAGILSATHISNGKRSKHALK